MGFPHEALLYGGIDQFVARTHAVHQGCARSRRADPGGREPAHDRRASNRCRQGRGPGRDPLTDRRRPAPNQDGGRGLWLANQLCDLVQIRSFPSGTTVRMHMHRDRSR
jgi:hypothetical protein